MGGASSHEEFNRQVIGLEEEVLMLNANPDKVRRRWFKLQDRKLSYSHSRGGLILNSTFLDQMFKVKSVSQVELEVMVEGLTLKGTKTWRLKFACFESFSKWVRSVQRALRPAWVKDSLMCSICSNLFNAFRRQHHCRRCGQAVCSAHSQHRIRIEELGYTNAVRVCDLCNRKTRSPCTSSVTRSLNDDRVRPVSLICENPKRTSTQYLHS